MKLILPESSLNDLILTLLVLIFSCCTPLTSLANQFDKSILLNKRGISKSMQGDFYSAIRDFEQACKLDPFNNKALLNLAKAHNNLGVSLANQKSYFEAIEHLEIATAQTPEDLTIRLNLLSLLVATQNRAKVEQQCFEIIKLRPEDSTIALKLATACQKTENHEAAKELLLKLTDRGIECPKLFEALSKLYYKTNNFNKTAYYVQKSLAIEPKNQNLSSFLSRLNLESQLKENSTSFKSPNFDMLCHNSFSQDWAYKILDYLEEAQRTIGNILDYYPTERSQVIVMFTEDFKKVHDLPLWAGGLYDGKIRIPITENSLSEQIRSAIMHEYTHHLIFLMSSGNCPVWLNEGLAQHFENQKMLEDKEVAIDPHKLESFLEIVHNSSPIEIAIAYKNAQIATERLIKKKGWQLITEMIKSMGHSEHKEVELLTLLTPDVSQ